MNDTTDTPLSLTVNGEPRLAQVADLAGLLEHLNLDPDKVVAELNGLIIPRENFSATPLAQGDSIELVRFVGGG
jgi:thiamine biosynthesis protein ThiS